MLIRRADPEHPFIAGALPNRSPYLIGQSGKGRLFISRCQATCRGSIKPILFRDSQPLCYGFLKSPIEEVFVSEFINPAIAWQLITFLNDESVNGMLNDCRTNPEVKV